ncbi:MAG: hypothetical protein U1E05_10870 [Patescibacteria group bacterium]|nr:hypothetical protein [Patescibacteria group bacterium]
MARHTAWLLIAFLVPAVLPVGADGAEGALSTIRGDVSGNAVASLASSIARQAGGGGGRHGGGDSFSAWFSFGALAAPLWIPIHLTQDDMQFDCYFQRYPYQVTHGSILRPYDLPGGPAGYEALAAERSASCRGLGSQFPRPRLRRWSGRFSAEYASEFADLERMTGRLVFNTASRFGLDTEMSYLQERLPGGGQDSLWLGDGNLIFRFAQGDRSEWRVGVGLNWLDDRQKTDYGFNFTYGFDLYPRRPWIMSLDIDWGTLGHTGLFRLRTTTGVVIWGLESYIGYEYLDIGRAESNSLIAGVRLWF